MHAHARFYSFECESFREACSELWEASLEARRYAALFGSRNCKRRASPDASKSYDGRAVCLFSIFFLRDIIGNRCKFNIW